MSGYALMASFCHFENSADETAFEAARFFKKHRRLRLAGIQQECELTSLFLMMMLIRQQQLSATAKRDLPDAGHAAAAPARSLSQQRAGNTRAF